MSVCRSCGAQIIWAVTTSGRRMPVDAAPVPNGNVALCPHPSPGHAPTAHIVSPQAEAHQDDRFTSHFATCPHADEHRTPRSH